MGNINKNDFDYIAYIDASGDDGLINPSIKTKGASSLTQVVAYFLTKTEDDTYNMRLLDTLKETVKLPLDKELKYKNIRKTHYKKEAYAIIGKFKGLLYASIYFKTAYLNEQKSKNTNQNTKKFENAMQSALLHIIPYLTKSLPDKKILCVYDHMKETDEKLIPSLEPAHKYKVIFKDSKDPVFSLIQTADIFAGIIRNYIEKTESELPTNLPLCHKTLYLCKKPLKKICRFNRGKPIPHATEFLRILPHMRANNDVVIFKSLMSIPVDSILGYQFIDCLWRPKYTAKNKTNAHN